MSRRLSREDRELWEKLRRTVRPLRRLGQLEEEGAPGEPSPEAAARVAAATPPAIVPAPSKPALPPLVTLEERARRRLSRGLADVDGRIDLHGMAQDRAFAALFGFLRQSQARGARTVLVITGKGRGGEDGRGILRQAVPFWLSRPEFRGLVAGFEPAGRRHGGEGALYVRIRRRREAGELRS